MDFWTTLVEVPDISFAELPEIYLTHAWAWRALIASIMVGITCGVLGCFIYLRNMALIGDALSHSILPGVAIVYTFFGQTLFGFSIGATVAGIITVLMITWIEQNIKTKADAVIGIIFTFMFAIGVIQISALSHQDGVHLDLGDFLMGKALGISNENLWMTFAVMVYVLICIVVFYRYLFVSTFQEVIAQTMGIPVKILHYFLMLLLSLAVVVSLQTVGVIMVVAMLITPASTAILLSDKLKSVLVIAAVIGALSGIIGMSLAIVLDTPPGAALVVVVSIFFFLAAMFAPKKGYLYRSIQKRRLKQKIQLEDTLKQLFKLHERESISFDNLLNRLTFSKAVLQKNLQKLSKDGFIQKNGGSLALTMEGKSEANRLVRAHRLWETYLVQQMGLTEEQIHEEAEKYEHLLTDEILDEVDVTLGYPTMDPHGSPIPTRKDHPDLPLYNLDINQKAVIDPQQNELISTKLWKLGLLPETSFQVQSKDKEFVEILLKEDTVKIPIVLARQVNIRLENAVN